MKRIAFGFLFVSSLAFADLIKGYPTEIQTTDQGIDFTVSCSPTSLSVAAGIKKACDDLSLTLEEIQCDIKKIRNPLYRCRTSFVSTSSCMTDKASIVHMDRAHSNYQAILTLMNTAYLSQNLVEFNVTKTDENSNEVYFQLQQVSLE